MALQGTLKDFGIADIFQLIGVQQKTGVLKLKDDDKSVNISFINGKIVGAEATIREKKEHLGEMLVRANIISKQDIVKALNYQKETLQKLGDILLKYNMANREDLREMVQLQMTETIYALFRWTKGDYEFVQQNIEYDKENITPISAEEILMDGYRMLDEWPKIKRVIKSPDMIFQKAFGSESRVIFGNEENESADKMDDAFALFDEEKKKIKSKPQKGAQSQKKLDKQEKRIFSYIDGKRPVQKIIDLSRLGEFVTCKILMTLVEEGLIEIATPAGEKKEEKAKYNVVETITNIVFLFIFIFIFSVITIPNKIFFETRKDDVLAEVRSARQLDKLRNAITLYHLLNKKYPPDLNALVSDNLVKKSDITDPTGVAYVYKINDNSFTIERFGVAPIDF